MILTVITKDDLADHLATIEDATARAMAVVATVGNPTQALRRMKFETIGFHPIDRRPLNMIEQDQPDLHVFGRSQGSRMASRQTS